MHNVKKTLLKEHGRELTECNQEWVELLCKYGNEIEYEQVKSESGNAMLAIMKYRRMLRLRDIGNIPFITLNTAYINKDYSKLHSLLQELFLEAINKAQFNYIVEQLYSINYGLLKLYNLHLKYQDKRIMNVILIL